ncbi:glycoside hydrolase family 6 protein [Aeromicrobium sp. Root495]|uniref:glycoside hydrolase family 6 protein n=1 Tax=Aeromicrobium sp. Root495 TaxID=1736550 RepID=UPI000A90AF93|nr:glycoside hydrolase family 6 protein [Aeromicrobium sp. Root495]
MSRKLAGSAVVVAVLAVLVMVVVLRGSSAPDANPFARARPLVDPQSAAAAAAASADGADQAVLARIADVPTAVWLVPEALDRAQVADRVTTLAQRARAERRVAVVVVYGIPQRDCSGQESAGGLDADGYQAWVQAIAEAGEGVVAVLEPDALATADECGLADQRTALLREAAKTLDEHGIWTYVDAGHSHWVEPRRMAQLIEAVGAEHLRGFATNVAGYETDADELAYARAVRAEVPSLHYVIDSGRNGVGPGAPGDFCNPPGRALGRQPATGTGGLDARLWIKPPGESDGACNGGPDAGQFWVEGALSLAAAAGWSETQ